MIWHDGDLFYCIPTRHCRASLWIFLLTKMGFCSLHQRCIWCVATRFERVHSWIPEGLVGSFLPGLVFMIVPWRRGWSPQHATTVFEHDIFLIINIYIYINMSTVYSFFFLKNHQKIRETPIPTQRLYSQLSGAYKTPGRLFPMGQELKHMTVRGGTGLSRW